MLTARRMMGDRGEALVAQLLEKAGFSIIARNYQKPFGEIDLVARQNDLMVFIEVKTRTKQLFDLTELITRTKQKKIIAAAKAFLAEKQLYENVCRFDVAIVEDVDRGIIEYIPDAFTE